MAETLSGSLGISVSIDHVGDSDTSTLTDKIAGVLKSWTIANGTGADQADVMGHDQRTLGTSASEDLDLSGALTDSFGTSVAFADRKSVV